MILWARYTIMIMEFWKRVSLYAIISIYLELYHRNPLLAREFTRPVSTESIMPKRIQGAFFYLATLDKAELESSRPIVTIYLRFTVCFLMPPIAITMLIFVTL